MPATEEDYRVKNAREGRAIYSPGKTVEEIKAEQSTLRALRVELKMTDDQANRFCDSLDDVAFLYTSAANLFDLIQEGASSGFAGSDHPGIVAACEFASIALRHKAETGGEAVNDLGRMLKSATIGSNKTYADQGDKSK
ncbi:hypothetical protein [Roseovarius mucosus]|uniref:hypothetical protein n=1 Tax=Roseovarius mucosus TaxID=215743 RepID=UPI003F712B65